MNAPWRNDGVTIACGQCGVGFRPVGRRRFCSAACRQAAWRHRLSSAASQARAATLGCPHHGAGRCPEPRSLQHQPDPAGAERPVCVPAHGGMTRAASPVS